MLHKYDVTITNENTKKKKPTLDNNRKKKISCRIGEGKYLFRDNRPLFFSYSKKNLDQNMSLKQQIQHDTEQFRTLFDRFSATHWSVSALPEAEAHYSACQDQARLVQQAIDEFNAVAEKEHKNLIKVKGPGVKHAWYKIRGKLDQHLDEKEKLWLQHFERCKEEEQRLTVINEEINSAQTYLHQCQNAFEEYIKTKRALDDLLERFFSGTKSVYPAKDAIEEDLRRTQTHLIMLQDDHRIFTNVCYLLQNAHQALTACREALNKAMRMNTFDLFSDSSFADVAVNSHLAHARNMSIRAQQLINEIRRVYPNIPFIGNLHIQQDNLLFNIMFDNIWTDMNLRAMISDAYDRISRADAVLTNVLFEMRQKLNECESDRDETSNDVKRLAAEHFNARIDIVKDIIESPCPHSSV